ncbi:helix-turn-helix domain-containing protein [Magnetovibrio sp. PR-2]|uniref:helix-turn-helix domain-containing protein n=1 Tax=Magnetovibrio sp. PR-2 TaxID=3120356 RepID=UPI002FCE241A
MTSTSDNTPGSVPRALFNLHGINNREKFAVWRESIACIFEVEAEKSVQNDNFHAEVDAHMFGPLMLARTHTISQRWDRSPFLIGRDGMDHYMIQLYESGNMAWEHGGQHHIFPVDGLLVFDLAQGIDLQTTEFTNLSLIIPRDLMEDQLKYPDDQHLRILSGRQPLVKMLRDFMLSLKRNAPEMTFVQAQELSPATIGLVAACINSSVSDHPDQRAGTQMAQLTILRRLIEDNLSNVELSVGWLARRAGMSRTKLYELFESFGGVANYVRDRRMRKALLILTDEGMRHRPLLDVAMDVGYANDTSFGRAFRARFGLSPGDVRGTRPESFLSTAPEDGIDRRYENWLHHLSL